MRPHDTEPARSSHLAKRENILTIALEDYFHGPAFARTIGRKHWSLFETRVERNCQLLLDQLDGRRSSATFFVTAWSANALPNVIREVVRRGHEIALAGSRTASFRFLSPAELRKRLRADRAVVETIIQRRVIGYRVTDVFMSERDLWALELLAEEGFAYDSSLSPLLWQFAQQPWRQFIHQNTFPTAELWEVPLSSVRIASMLFPMAGGNYFRQLPETAVNAGLKYLLRNGAEPAVLYFRVWDLDPEQPELQTVSRIRKLQHYRNRKRIVRTLSTLLDSYQFTSISRYLGLTQPAHIVPDGHISYQAILPERQKRVSQRPPVSVIVPCYNEQETISYLRNALHELKQALAAEYDLRFILVDDGSQDQTWPMFVKHFKSDADTLLIRHEANRGVAAAISTGLQKAGEIACSIDCDCSYDPLLLKPMLELMTAEVDLVTASPYHPNGSVLNVPGWRLLLSKGSSRLYRIVTGQKLHTFTSCLRVYRRSSVIDIELRHSGFLGVAELIGCLAEQKKTIVEYPSLLESRLLGRSKMKIARTVCGHLAVLTHLGWRRARSRFARRSMQASNSATTPSENLVEVKLR